MKEREWKASQDTPSAPVSCQVKNPGASLVTGRSCLVSPPRRAPFPTLYRDVAVRRNIIRRPLPRALSRRLLYSAIFPPFRIWPQFEPAALFTAGVSALPRWLFPSLSHVIPRVISQARLSTPRNRSWQLQIRA